ncbi:MAG: hypothetical protein ACLGIT_05800 [Gammaproteobacteria bacterium]
MNPTLLRATLATLALAATTAFAGDHHERSHDRRGDDRDHAAMQTVPHAAAAGEPGHGWQYFSDRGHARAVVISPEGDYYYSRGKGLRQVVSAGHEPVDPRPSVR